MLNDTRSVRGGGIETDVCVIGAGPAGITFALQCAGLPLRVCMLESGRFEPDAAAQALTASATLSDHHAPRALADGRQRQFGGTSSLWVHHTVPGNGRRHARMLPPEPIDFEQRAWLPNSGWPFDTAALRPFYERAQHLWNGGSLDYDPAAWTDQATAPLPFGDGPLTTRMCQYGPRDVFTLRYRDDLLQADNVEVCVGSTVLALEPDRDGATVRRARVACPDGSTFSVTAKVFVLAGGCVENVQLLLLSEGTRPGDPGNRHDNVGRYVTDHQDFRMGVITPAQPDLFDRLALYDLHWVDRFLVSGILTLTEEAKRRERLLNVCALLLPQPAGYGSAAERSIKSLLALRRGERLTGALADARAVVAHLGDAAAVLRMRTIDRNRLYREFRGGWSRAGAARGRFGVVEVIAATEQTPSPDNRITLSPALDRLGRRQAQLHWRWSDRDRENITRTRRIFADEIERAGFGRFTQWVDLDGPARPFFPAIHHPMGGTRMHPDPRHGVVDADCLMHGTSNLYVAGSSVFPTGLGYANPTLTILALTTRLADHVKARLGASAPARTA